jgi:CHASE3 domain sensor protein
MEKINMIGTGESVSNKIQSEMFEDSFLKNLKVLQGRIGQQHVENSESKSGDIQYIGDSTRKLVELKLLELETVINARKKEEEWIRKREIRSAQSDRIEQARKNLTSLMLLEEKGKKGLDDDIENNLSILREVSSIGSDEISVKDHDSDNTDKILDSFHMNEKDLRKAFRTTNVMDIIRQAKINGWTMTISEDEVALYKNGKRINGTGNVFVNSVSSESSDTKKKREKDLCKILNNFKKCSVIKNKKQSEIK